MADLKLSAIFLAAVSMFPSRVRVIPRYLNSVTSSRVVPSCCRTWKWESQKYFCWRRPWLCFVSVQLEPFETCLVIKFVQLELQIFSRVWSESNVVRIITVRDFNWIKGSGSTSLYSQESVYVIVIKGVQGDSEGNPVSSLCWAQPPQKFCRHQFVGIGILCTWFEWHLSNTAES